MPPSHFELTEEYERGYIAFVGPGCWHWSVDTATDTREGVASSREQAIADAEAAIREAHDG